MSHSGFLRCSFLMALALGAAGCVSAASPTAEPTADPTAAPTLTTDEPFVDLREVRRELPDGLRFVECPGGRNRDSLEVFGFAGGIIDLEPGHRLVITRGAVLFPWFFTFGEPRSNQVMVEAEAPLLNRLGGGGARIRISWADRGACEVREGAVIVQLRKNEEPVVWRGRIDSRRRTIETIEPVHDFSTFAIAQ